MSEEFTFEESGKEWEEKSRKRALRQSGEISPTEKMFPLLKDEETRERMTNEMVSFIEQLHDDPERPDVLVFLDKSARPAAWFFIDLWKVKYPGEDWPQIKFVNIGREKVNDVNFVGYFSSREDERKYVKAIKSDTEKVEELRETFKDLTKNKQRIMIIDEYSVEGGSLITARALFQAAFKNKHVGKIEEHAIFSEEVPWLWMYKAIGVREGNEEDLFVEGLEGMDPQEIVLRARLKEWVEEYSKSLKP